MPVHVVKAGQTIWKIAGQYHVPVSQIVNLNKLTYPNKLVAGQSLVIPASYAYHTVKPGETLWTISKEYGIPVQTLIEVNNIENPNNLSAGTVLAVYSRKKKEIEVNGYTYQFGEEGVPTVREEGKDLTFLSPFAYKIQENGSLQTVDDTALIKEAYSVHVAPMMAVTNFTSTEKGGNLAHTVLGTPSIREATITNIINTMRNKGYRGVNIDFENVLPSDRENYNQFLQRAVERMHPLGFFVSTALAPKTSAGQQGQLYEAHDYPAHGRIVDFVVLMTYEWGYRKGAPQAISPLDQIKRVIDYAVSVIPSNKIFFGFQLYARDWVIPHVEGREAETFDNQEAINRAVRNNAVIEYDTKAQSPFYRYTGKNGVRHEVWFEDARSAQAKFDMVKSYNLRGISYWVLGYPFPQNWALLEENFTIKKIL